MIAVCDYDAGNVNSVMKACGYLGYECVLTSDHDTIMSSDHIILPGVGSFGVAIQKLRDRGLDTTIEQAVGKGIPFLGICLGLQLIFEKSDESPDARGLGLLEGGIIRIPDNNGSLKVPHMGWNSLSFPSESRLFRGIPDGTDVYFVHSYYLPVNSYVKAVTQYGVQIGAGIEKGNIFACQFHPEKSGRWGLKILDNFLSLSGG